MILQTRSLVLRGYADVVGLVTRLILDHLGIGLLDRPAEKVSERRGTGETVQVYW
jgi:hypothetical protein